MNMAKSPMMEALLLLVSLVVLVMGRCVGNPSTSALASSSSAPALAGTVPSSIIVSEATLLRRSSQHVGQFRSSVTSRDGDNGTPQVTRTLDTGPIVGLVGIAVAIVIAVAQDWRRSRGEKHKAQDSNVSHGREEHEFDGVSLGARPQDHELRGRGSVTDNFMRGAMDMPMEHPEQVTQRSTWRETRATRFGGIVSPACPEPAVLRGTPVASFGAPFDQWVRPVRKRDRDELKRPQRNNPGHPQSGTTQDISEGNAVNVSPNSSAAQLSFPLEERSGTVTPAPEVAVLENPAHEARELGLRNPSPDCVVSVNFPDTLGRTHASASDPHGECDGGVPAPADEAIQDPLGAVDMNRVVCRAAREIDGGQALSEGRKPASPAAEVQLVEETARICVAPTMVDAGAQL